MIPPPDLFGGQGQQLVRRAARLEGACDLQALQLQERLASPIGLSFTHRTITSGVLRTYGAMCSAADRTSVNVSML